MIYIYNAFTCLLLPVYLVILMWRVLKSKEQINRLGERFAITNKARLAQPVTWLHAASVGEVNIILTLIENISLITPNTNFLITSNTLTSFEVLKTKLPQNATHQFLPIDNIIFVKKFLKYWQPKLAIFIEAEIWPCLISEAAKVCKLLLLNAHISDRSYKRWHNIKPFFKKVMANFSAVITKSIFDFNKYKSLGVSKLINIGNIKFANKKLPVNNQELIRLKAHLQDKQVIVLASTHPSDEQVVLKVIKPIKERYLHCYFILVLRHPNRRLAIARECGKNRLTYKLRSQTNMLDINDDLYIVDTFGELGLFYSLAHISFVGGSFGRGGHNPLEPAHFANLILFGPDMAHCRAIASSMLKNKAAIQFNTTEDLHNLLAYFLSLEGIEQAKVFKTNASIFVNQHQQIWQNYLTIVTKYVKCLN